MKKMIVPIIKLVLVAMLVLGSVSMAALAGDESSGGLFSDSSTVGSLDLSKDAIVMRARYVNIRFDLLDPANPTSGAWLHKGDTLLLNLFDDAAFSAVLDQGIANSDNSYTWVGHLEGIELSNVTLSVENGIMSGNVVFPGGFYAIRYAGNGVHAIKQMNEAAFPPEAEPVPVDLPADDPVQRPSIESVDDGSTIDVMVVYTAAAKSAAGGTTSAINTLINLAVSETNTSYDNSGISQRLNLVYKGQIAYSEAGFNWNTTLTRLRGTADGFMDNVHSLRNTYKADEVVLLVANIDYCGMAYLMTSVSSTFKTNAFALVSYDCATGYYSFGHELGHTMAARHDWYVDSTLGSPYDYNHGYVHTGATNPNRWRTVMAYNDKCADLGYNCTRIQYWSNPSVNYNGAATGTAAYENNRRTLNNTAYTVANFRKSAGFDSQFNSNANGWTPLKGTWSIVSSSYYKTVGVGDKFSSTKHTNTYSTLTYEARMKREGGANNSNSLIIRGNGVLNASGWWTHMYAFNYNRNGQFSVWKDNEIAIKDWTSSTHINGDGWNTLKVTASGNQLKFYINGHLVWQGSNSAYASGTVGIGMYRSGGSTGNELLVDWAKLSTSVADPWFDEVIDDIQVELTGGNINEGP